MKFLLEKIPEDKLFCWIFALSVFTAEIILEFFKNTIEIHLLGADAITKLWNSLLDSGYDSFDMGLPGNIYCINNADMAAVQLSLPFGGYQNGGITLSQSKHFINGLYAVGMNNEADYILSELCKGLLYGTVIGGVGSGLDWKTWDGVACGYEGLLSDQLGIFQPLIKRYSENK